jgi:hypothetical protein
VYEELERIWKEMVMARDTILDISLEGLRKITRTLNQDTHVLVEIQAKNLLNTNLEHYH